MMNKIDLFGKQIPSFNICPSSHKWFILCQYEDSPGSFSMKQHLLIVRNKRFMLILMHMNRSVLCHLQISGKRRTNLPSISSLFFTIEAKVPATKCHDSSLIQPSLLLIEIMKEQHQATYNYKRLITHAVLSGLNKRMW